MSGRQSKSSWPKPLAETSHSMITACAVKGAAKAIYDAEAALAKKDNAQGRALVKEARDLIAAVPKEKRRSLKLA